MVSPLAWLGPVGGGEKVGEGACRPSPPGVRQFGQGPPRHTALKIKRWPPRRRVDAHVENLSAWWKSEIWIPPPPLRWLEWRLCNVSCNPPPRHESRKRDSHCCLAAVAPCTAGRKDTRPTPSVLAGATVTAVFYAASPRRHRAAAGKGIGLRIENTGPHSSRARRCQTRSMFTSRLSAPWRRREAPEAPLEAGDNGTNSRRCGLAQLRARVLGEVRSFHKRPAPSGVVTHTAAVAGRTFSILTPPSCRQSRTSQQSMALGTTPFSAARRGPCSVRNVTITTLVSACYGFEPVEACVWTQ